MLVGKARRFVGSPSNRSWTEQFYAKVNRMAIDHSSTVLWRCKRFAIWCTPTSHGWRQQRGNGHQPNRGTRRRMDREGNQEIHGSRALLQLRRSALQVFFNYPSLAYF